FGIDRELVAALAERGDLVRIGTEAVFLPEAVADFAEKVIVEMAAVGRVTVARARDLGGSSRKHVLPLLQFLDDQGVTRRSGDDPRIVLVGAGKPGELDAERVRNIASAGIRALWRSSLRKVAIGVPRGALTSARAVQASVEGAIYAMWRPEVHRTRSEERHLPE